MVANLASVVQREVQQGAPQACRHRAACNRVTWPVPGRRLLLQLSPGLAVALLVSVRVALRSAALGYHTAGACTGISTSKDMGPRWAGEGRGVRSSPQSPRPQVGINSAGPAPGAVPPRPRS